MSKAWASAALDFVITAGTAFLALPADAEITARVLITIVIGSLVATGKGMQTYHATHPSKEETSKP